MVRPPSPEAAGALTRRVPFPVLASLLASLLFLALLVLVVLFQ